MSKAIQLKSKTAFSAFLFELGKLIRLYLFNNPSRKQQANEMKPRFKRLDPLPELKPHHRRFIAMSYFNSLAVHGKIALAYRVLELIESYPQTFDSTVPSIHAFKSILDGLWNAYGKYEMENRSLYYREKMMEKEKEFKVIFRQVIRYVESVGNGDPEVWKKVDWKLQVTNNK